MANRIAGITVEIGGDTTKLSTALKSMNQEIRSTQQQLKDVNSLLKLDPGNTELLAQKQKLLKDGLLYPYTEDDAEEFIRAMLSADEESTFAFAITLDDKVIGSIGVFRQTNIHSRTAEMGYYIGEPYWGNGYMTNAIKQACEYVFENTDIIRIFAEPFAHNQASCRALEKAGFQYEGTLKSNAVKCGSVIDMKMYALIKE